MYIHTIAGLLALIYGALIAFSALRKMRRGELPISLTALLGFLGLVVMFSSLLIPFQVIGAFYTLILGLALMHALTIRIDKQREDEFNPKPHVIRFVFSILIVIMASTGMF